jgi:ligand-binding sensor domain-containing protein
MFKFRFSYSIIFLICFYSTLLKGQKLKFEPMGIRQGLPSTEVYNLYQDKKDYVWAFTEYGIVKHNGIEFIPVCKNIPVSESSVYVVAENSKGQMYVANSKANIYKIRNDSAFFIKGIEKVSRYMMSENEIMFDMIIDDSSNIYFSTLHSSYKFCPTNNTVCDLTDYYSKNYSGLCFKKVQDHYFLIRLNKKTDANTFITLLNEKDAVIAQLPYAISKEERNVIRKQKNGFYFLTRRKVIYLSDSGEIKEVSFNENTINFEISSDGRIWVGTQAGGLYELNSNLVIINHYLEGYTVSDILSDKQLGMWVSTIENGVHYCKNIYDVYYENIPELTENISLLKKINRKLFIGTANGNFFIKDEDQLRKINSYDYPSCINDVTEYKGNYLVGTKDGIWALDKSFEVKRPINTNLGTYQSLNAYGFSKGESDSLVFISASTIAKYVPDKIISSFPAKTRTRSIIKRKRNEYAIGTFQGLFIYDSTFHSTDYLKDLVGIRITKLKTDGKQNIWICTRGNGLYKLTINNKIIRYENVPSEVINDISFINENVVLLSTNKGLFINYTGDLNTKSAWILILDNETLSAEEYNDEIYIATKQGLISLNSKYLFKNDNAKFYLESIIIDGKKIDPDNFNLNYKQNDIYFNFDFLAYQFPDKKLFYQLFGNSSNKGIVKGTQLHLQNLSPGNYTLIVHPLINFSSKRIFKISFYIEPAFWQTQAFFISIIVSIFLIVILTTTFVFYRLKKKEERKTALTQLLAEYRLTALKAQINPHFISNSLSAIQQLIIQNEIDKANQYIAKFSLLIRYVLKYSDKSAVRLKHEIEIIDLNIDLEQLRFGNNFSFEKEINPEIETGDIYIPPLISQPFIENAIWHGLLPLKGKRPPKLILKIDIINECLIIAIIDNGVGRSTGNSYGNESDRESKGTWLIKSRIENLNQMYSTAGAAINFIDLLDEEKKPVGTKVEIVFPIKMLIELHDEKNK